MANFNSAKIQSTDSIQNLMNYHCGNVRLVSILFQERRLFHTSIFPFTLHNFCMNALIWLRQSWKLICQCSWKFGSLHLRIIYVFIFIFKSVSTYFYFPRRYFYMTPRCEFSSEFFTCLIEIPSEKLMEKVKSCFWFWYLHICCCIFSWWR